MEDVRILNLNKSGTLTITNLKEVSNLAKDATTMITGNTVTNSTTSMALCDRMLNSDKEAFTVHLKRSNNIKTRTTRLLRISDCFVLCFCERL